MYKNKEKQKEYARKHYLANKDKMVKRAMLHKEAERKRRLEKVWEIKSVPCADCGNSFHPYAMDFDHRDFKSKSANISDMIAKSRPWALIMEEIAKCDIVCANCHRLRTFLCSQGVKAYPS